MLCFTAQNAACVFTLFPASVELYCSALRDTLCVLRSGVFHSPKGRHADTLAIVVSFRTSYCYHY